jgi:hypothetical protein
VDFVRAGAVQQMFLFTSRVSSPSKTIIYNSPANLREERNQTHIMAPRKALGTIDINGTIKITTNQAVVLDKAFLDSLTRIPAPDENVSNLCYAEEMASEGTQASASKGKVTKRKAVAESREEIDIDDDRCQAVTISCNAVRTKIRKFIESGEMKGME